VPTLNAFDTGDTRATTIIFYGNRVNDLRLQGEVINTLQARMGTGGNNMPMVAYPIQDGREMEKKQNGLGVGENTDPSYTLDRTGGQSVAFAIQGTSIGRSDNAGPNGKGFGAADDPMFTLDSGAGTNAVANTSTVRRLTPVECERLQGFPDGWTECVSDSQRYKQMGNAVTVNVVAWIGGNL
jgi:DNA (cytosine-5)-methyltransferase 1